MADQPRKRHLVAQVTMKPRRFEEYLDKLFDEGAELISVTPMLEHPEREMITWVIVYRDLDGAM